jgi:hypothetical protein
MSGADSLKCELRPGRLAIRVLGRDILENKEATVKVIAELIRTHQAKAALIDLREVPGEVTFLDRYELGELAGRHLAQTLIAVLVLEQQADHQRIGKIVARNRGANLEVFTDQASAEAWIDAGGT